MRQIKSNTGKSTSPTAIGVSAVAHIHPFFIQGPMRKRANRSIDLRVWMASKASPKD